MKTLAIDPGDKHVGVAISDALNMFAHPYKTIDASNLENELEEILNDEDVSTVIVGYPKTLRGTKSEQTLKVEKLKEKLEKKFNNIKWILWDERLTSKSAQQIKKPKTKNEKLKVHAIAAAIILASYLNSR